MKLHLPLVFLFLICTHLAWSQGSNLDKKIDSLLALNISYKIEDSLRLTRYNQLYRNYMKLANTTAANNYVDQTILLAKKLNKPVFIADAYFRTGFYHHTHSRYFLAEEYYKRALEKYGELNNKEWLGGIYQNLSAMYANIPDYSKALDANFKAVNIFTEIKDVESVASCYVNIASIYSGLNQHYSAIQYLDKALKIFLNSNGNEYGIALCYVNLGDAYFEANDEELKKVPINKSEKYNKSLWNLEQSLKYAEKIDNNFSLLASINQTKGNIFNAIGKKDLAEESYNRSVDYYSKTSAKKEYATGLLSLANFYIAENQYIKAEPLVTEAIQIGNQNKIPSLQRDGYMASTTLNEKQGRYNDALRNFKDYILFKEQIFNEEKEREITRKQMQLDFSIKERDYQTKQQLTDLELDKQLLLVKRRQQELLLKQQELALSDKEKNIQRLNFLQEQAALENDKLQKENQLRQEKLSAKLQQEQAGQQLLVKENKIKLNRNFSIFFGMLAVVLLVAATFVYLAQRKTAKLNKLVLVQKEELEKLGRVKDRIFSVVSHDMRAPVNSLMAFINLLENGNVSEEKLKRYSANLKNSLGYTSNMMENLLNWASSQLEGYKPVIEKIDVLECLTEVIDTQDINAGQKNIAINNQIPANLMCRADCDMLSLVVRNLLSNAVKFTPVGGTIDIIGTINETTAEITIRDSGVGMDEEEVARFNNTQHYGVNKTTLGTNSEKGTGIGLSLCKTFIHLMNGSLFLKSRPANGSAFTIRLPK